MLRKLPNHTRFLLICATAVAGVLLGLVLVGGLEMVFTPSPALAVANPQDVPDGVDETQATHTCDIANIGIFSVRIHVRCRNAAGSISYFAMSTSNVNVNRVLSLLLAAETANKLLFIAYDPNVSGASIGCLISDCRLIAAIYLLD